MDELKKGYWITDGKQLGVYLDYDIVNDALLCRAVDNGDLIKIWGSAATYATPEQIRDAGLDGTGYGKVWQIYGRIF